MFIFQSSVTQISPSTAAQNYIKATETSLFNLYKETNQKTRIDAASQIATTTLKLMENMPGKNLNPDQIKAAALCYQTIVYLLKDPNFSWPDETKQQMNASLDKLSAAYSGNTDFQTGLKYYDSYLKVLNAGATALDFNSIKKLTEFVNDVATSDLLMHRSTKKFIFQVKANDVSNIQAILNHIDDVRVFSEVKNSDLNVKIPKGSANVEFWGVEDVAWNGTPLTKTTQVNTTDVTRKSNMDVSSSAAYAPFTVAELAQFAALMGQVDNTDTRSGVGKGVLFTEFDLATFNYGELVKYSAKYSKKSTELYQKTLSEAADDAQFKVNALVYAYAVKMKYINDQTSPGMSPAEILQLEASSVHDFLTHHPEFYATLKQQVQGGTFKINCSASTENVGNLPDYCTQMLVAEQRGIVIAKAINNLLTDAGFEELNFEKCITPSIKLIKEIDQATLDKIMGWKEGDKIIVGGKDLAKTPGFALLVDFVKNRYNEAEIKDQRLLVISDIMANYKKEFSGAVKEIKENGAVTDYEITDVATFNSLNSLNRWFAGKKSLRLDKTKPGTDKSFELGSSRSGGLSFESLLDLHVRLGAPTSTPEAGKLAEFPLDVIYITDGKTGKIAQPPVAMVFDVTDANAPVEVKSSTVGSDGNYTVSFIPDAGKKYSVVAYAENDAKSISTSVVRQTVEVEAPPQETQVLPKIRLKNRSVTPGEYKKLKFIISENPQQLPIMIAFGVLLSGQSQPKYLYSPYKGSKVGEEAVYSINIGNDKKSIIVDRGLRHKTTSYEKKQLIAEMDKGAVAVKWTIEDKDKNVKDMWVTLDGKYKLSDEDVKRYAQQGGFLYLKQSSPMPSYEFKKVLSTKPKTVKNVVIPALPDDKQEQRILSIPNAIALYDGELTRNGVTFSKKQLEELAGQNIIAFIASTGEKGNVKKLYGIDGREICDFSVLTSGNFAPNVEGIFVPVVRSISEPSEFKINSYIPDIYEQKKKQKAQSTDFISPAIFYVNPANKNSNIEN
ncbi:MAG: hypothetical protein NT051_02270 [Candidatus Micrarchaeota archaeon]|nr:hypothetical protein [Candidatus Micrarchaeota archaeon]